MPKFYFVPESWELSDDLRKWTKAKGLSDKSIEDEIESFRDHEYRRAMSRPDACWRNWVKNAIKWGNVETVSPSQYRQREVISDEQKAEDRRLGDENLKRLGEMSKTALKVVK